MVHFSETITAHEFGWGSAWYFGSSVTWIIACPFYILLINVGYVLEVGQTLQQMP